MELEWGSVQLWNGSWMICLDWSERVRLPNWGGYTIPQLYGSPIQFHFTKSSLLLSRLATQLREISAGRSKPSEKKVRYR